MSFSLELRHRGKRPSTLVIFTIFANTAPSNNDTVILEAGYFA